MPKTENRFKEVGLTYDDILLKVQYSDLDPSKVNVETRLTKKIRLKVPILSAAMDTVTESQMSIALALEGGLGVIHRNMSPEQQALEVEKVKRFESGFVENPLTLSPTNSLADAREINKKYSGIPITEDGSANGKLVGLITSKDYYFDDPDKHLIKEYMTPFEDLVIDFDGITLERANKRLKESKKGMVLIINNKKSRKLMSIVCRKDLEKNYYYPNACKDKNKRLRFIGHGCAVGPEAINKSLSKKRAKMFHDKFLKDVKDRYPDLYDKIKQRMDPPDGHGESEPLSFKSQNGAIVVLGDNETPLGRQLNRRVLILFYTAK